MVETKPKSSVPPVVQSQPLEVRGELVSYRENFFARSSISIREFGQICKNLSILVQKKVIAHRNLGVAMMPLVMGAMLNVMATTVVDYFKASPAIMGTHRTLLSKKQKPAVTPAGYTGPGDVVSSAREWYGLRCYNSAYTGSIADIFAPLDASHTLLTCSTGGVINETVQALATTCAVSCTVKTLFNQAGTTNCSASSCDLAQATIANRPAYTSNCLGSLPCMTFARASSQSMKSAAAPSSQSQPYSFSSVANYTGADGTFSIILAYGGGSLQIGNDFGAINRAYVLDHSGGNVLFGTASDNVAHPLQFVVNGASPNSITTVDATDTTGTLDTDATESANTVVIGGDNGGNHLYEGKIFEVGFWGAGFTGTQRTNMCHNQFTYWGTATSC